jgi:serine/threonine-protein kinase
MPLLGGAAVTDLFLSYKAEDRSRVAPLVQALENDGLSVWWDEHIGGGDEWRDTILRHLETARAVVVVWSRRSVGPNGQFVRDEATRALKRGVYVPVRIDKVDPPLGFGETQAFDLQGWKGDRSDPRYQATLATLRKRLGIKSGTAKRSAEPAAGVSRRTVVIGGSLAAVSAAGVAAWFLARPQGERGESIAVLPFANLSGDPAQSYFSEGIAEELRSALSRIAGLKVVARTSSEAVKDEDAKTAAHELGVNNILTGSVRRSPQMIRVSAQLVDGQQGLERWAEVYDRPPADALEVQTDIADKVAEALSIRLGGADRERLAQGGTNNPEAHDLLLKAEQYQKDESRESVQRAIGVVDAALALDPKYGDAWSTKAQLLSLQAGRFSMNAAQFRAGYGAAEEIARKAIQVAPQSRRGYAALGEILDQQLKRRAAFVQFRKMLALSGEEGRTLPIYATFLSEIGRSGEALQAADQAIALDPLNSRSYGRKAAILANARRYTDAIRVLEKAAQLSPGVKGIASFRAYCLAMSGRTAEARRELSATFGDPADAPPGWAASLLRGGSDPALGERLLAGLRESTGDGAPYQYAQIYAQLGRKEEALDALQKAWDVRDPGLTTMLVDPLLDPVRNEPRFRDILRLIDNPT